MTLIYIGLIGIGSAAVASLFAPLALKLTRILQDRFYPEAKEYTPARSRVVVGQR